MALPIALPIRASALRRPCLLSPPGAGVKLKPGALGWHPVAGISTSLRPAQRIRARAEGSVNVASGPSSLQKLGLYAKACFCLVLPQLPWLCAFWLWQGEWPQAVKMAMLVCAALMSAMGVASASLKFARHTLNILLQERKASAAAAGTDSDALSQSQLKSLSQLAWVEGILESSAGGYAQLARVLQQVQQALDSGSKLAQSECERLVEELVEAHEKCFDPGADFSESIEQLDKELSAGYSPYLLEVMERVRRVRTGLKRIALLQSEVSRLMDALKERVGSSDG